MAAPLIAPASVMSSSSPNNAWFRVVVVIGGLFAVTTMAMLAAAFGDQNAPPARFLNAYGVSLIVVETLLLVIVSFVALAIDRRQTLAAVRSRQVLHPPATNSGNANAGQSAGASQ